MREVADMDAVADDAFARGQRLDSGEQPNHGRLAGAIGTNQREPRAPLDFEADAAIDGEVSVTFDRAPQFDHAAAAAFG